MILVIDTNVLLSALIRDSNTRKVLMESGWQFYYPEISFHEIRKYKQLVLEKSGFDEEEYISLLGNLLSKLRLVTIEQIKPKIKEANDLIGKRDPKDVVFLAVALSIEGSAIWSNDKDFDEQTRLIRYNTERILKVLKE